MLLPGLLVVANVGLVGSQVQCKVEQAITLFCLAPTIYRAPSYTCLHEGEPV